MQLASAEARAEPGWILLPEGRKPVRGEPVPEAQLDSGAGTIKRRLLIVDDDWLISIQIEQLLTAAGFTIVGTAPDAATAVVLAELERPDLVLMDIRLHGPVDGVEAAREIIDRF